MREILFRGKHQKAGWVYGSYIRHESRQLCPMGGDKLKPEEIEHYIARDSFADWNMPRTIELVPVNPETVGQYTGLMDKNGKKIFEGDIVSRKLPNKEYRYLVGFSNGEFELQFNGRHELNLFIAHLTESELIGNIHDNPELLREDEI